MDNLDFDAQYELDKYRNDNIFKAIFNLFKGENDNILYALYSKGFRTLSIDSLKKCGFNTSILVKSDSRIENPLLGSINYFDENYFIGFNLILYNRSSDYFYLIRTNNSDKKVAILTSIRSKKYEIDGLLNSAYMYSSGELGPEMHLANYYKNEAQRASLELEVLKKQLESLF